MAIPSYQQLMLPLLRVLSESGNMLHLNESSALIADQLGLSDEERQAMLPSGTQTFLKNRTAWAGWYLLQAELVERPKRGYLRISDEGKKLLLKNLSSIDTKVLAEYPSFVEKVLKSKETEEGGVVEETNPPAQTPTEQIEEAHQELNETLAAELLELMGKMDPYRFEQLVVDLLIAMGYGGSRAEAALVTGKSNDEGIDGLISEDRLGLDVIYVQAKRWKASVGRVEVQNFVGALVGKHAQKGVFITTSDFQKTAIEYAKSVQHKIILINGKRLAEFMIEHSVGVSTIRTLAIKRVDSDYFEE